MPTVEYEIYLPKPISGQALVEAIQQIAKDEFHREGMTIGQSSMYPFADCIIAVGQGFGTHMVKPERSYTCLAVQDYEWGGIKYAVGYSDDDVIEAVKSFRDELIVALAAQLGMSVEEITRLTDARQGMAHGDARYVCNHCGNGLATNIGPCRHCGAQAGELTPLW